MLQYKIEALDREDFEVSAIVLEDTTPPLERSIKLLFADNNNDNTGLSSLANILVDLESICFL